MGNFTPCMDVETYSESGFAYDEAARKWKPSHDGSKKSGLPLVGVHNYVNHPSFEVLSLTYDIGRGERLWVPGCAPPQDLFDYLRADGIIEAWNVGFERTVWEDYCVPILGWPAVRPDQWRCAMAKSAANGYPQGLDDCAEVLRCTERKDKKGKALIRKLTVPRAPTIKNPDLRLYPHTAPEEFAQFYGYNVQDVVVERAVSDRIPDLCPRELDIWRVDQAINRRGMQIDVRSVQASIVIIEQAYAKYNGELCAITCGAVKASSEVAATVRWLAAQGIFVPNLEEDVVDENLKRDHSAAVKRLFQIRQALAFGSVRKLYAMRAQVCADGRLRDQYVYHGAHTSLWNGRAVQPANLYKGKLDKPEKVEAALAVIASGSLEYVELMYGDALECVADCLRSMIIPAPGKRLIASDYAAIQAVVTSALAGEKWRLDVFHGHGKIYEAMASELTGNTLEHYATFKKEHSKHHEDRRLGKLAVLSGDFGAWLNGWKRFGAEEILGDDKTIKDLILKTRARIPNIVEFWGGQTRNKFNKGGPERPELFGLEGAAIAATLNPGQCYGYRTVLYQVQGDILYCQPPGGGAPLQYHAPRLERAQREWASPWEYDLSYEGWNSNATKGAAGWQRMKLYGGVLCIGAGTEVLTARGWVPIERCTNADAIWDGIDWVYSGGLACQGIRKVIDYESILMTPDHEVLTHDGWKKAHVAQSEGLRRIAVRLPDDLGVLAQREGQDVVAGAMRLRRLGDGPRVGDCQEKSSRAVVRLSDQTLTVRSPADPRDVSTSRISRMGLDARPLPASVASSLAQLRRARDTGLRALGKLRSFLGRHGAYLLAGAVFRSNRQRRALQTGQLSLDRSHNTGEQPSVHGADRDAKRAHVDRRDIPGVRHIESQALLPVESRKIFVRTYDLVDCGPRHRFVVRGRDGVPTIVHNCQNVVSKVSREFQADSLVALDRTELYLPVGHAHDEIVTEVENGKGNVAEYLEIVNRGKPWAVDDWGRPWPIKAPDAEETQRYGKWS